MYIIGGKEKISRHYPIMVHKKVLFLLGILRFCYAFQQEFVLYTEKNFAGDALVIRSKRPDLVPLSPEIITNATSYCFRGLWIFYENTDYKGRKVVSNGLKSMRCLADNKYMDNSSLPGSARFLGPEETNCVSITFYEEKEYAGRELLVEGPAYGHIPFSPKSFFATGNSHWTFYTGENFNGTAICVIPTYSEYNYFNMKPSLTGVRSVIKGCYNTCNNPSDNCVSMQDMSE